MSYAIPTANLSSVLTQIEKLNKRARKIGAEPIEVKIVEEELRDWRPYKGSDMTVKRSYTLVELVSGAVFSIGGWEFVATLTPLSEEGDILIRSFTDQACPKRFRQAKVDWCDHCKTSRYRKHLYVLRNQKSGRYQQVGSTCLKDFLGHDPTSILKQAEYRYDIIDIIEATEDDLYGSGGERGISLRSYLLEVMLDIRECGWVSATVARETDQTSTAVRAWTSCVTPPKSGEQRPINRPTDIDVVEKALAWIEKANTKSDYMHSLQVACKYEAVTHNTRGLVASLLPTFFREEKRNKARKVEQMQSSSQHVGKIKKRQVFPQLTVLFTTVLDDDLYGPKTLIKFRDPKGNDLVWFASGCRMEDFPIGHTLNIKATVKQHGQYMGRAQTVINRAVILEEVPA